MKMKIDADVLKKTTHCEKNFECLDELKSTCHIRKNCLKKAECYISDDFFVVKCTEIGCNYYNNFGGYCTCNCPTRLEIYKKYSL